MNELIEKVNKMRQLQKRYFSERSSLILQQCKAAERDVDALLHMLENGLKTTDCQTKLF